MKKILFTLLAIFLLVGCSSKSPDRKDNYYFKLANKDIAMDQEAKAFIATLGDPKDTYSSPSCAFEGEDTVYDYGSYQITTYVSEGVEKFTGFYLIDETVSTKEGIHIGSTLIDMVAKYGKEYTESFGAYTYSLGLTDLSFVVVDDKVTSISYLYAVD